MPSSAWKKKNKKQQQQHQQQTNKQTEISENKKATQKATADFYSATSLKIKTQEVYGQNGIIDCQQEKSSQR
mgnify:CR=1 FL=1